MRPMDTAPRDESWVLLEFANAGGFCSESGFCIAFWSTGEDPGWYDSEAASKPVTAFGDEPIGWHPLPASCDRKEQS